MLFLSCVIQYLNFIKSSFKYIEIQPYRIYIIYQDMYKN